ncbi:Armadillo repeat-containing protein 8, partial [Clarias magur]
LYSLDQLHQWLDLRFQLILHQNNLPYKAPPQPPQSNKHQELQPPQVPQVLLGLERISQKPRLKPRLRKVQMMCMLQSPVRLNTLSPSTSSSL